MAVVSRTFIGRRANYKPTSVPSKNGLNPLKMAFGKIYAFPLEQNCPPTGKKYKKTDLILK